MIMQEQRTKCLSARMGALVFAILNVIFTAFWSLVSLGLIFYIGMSLIFLMGGDGVPQQYAVLHAIRNLGVLAVSSIMSMVSFMFAIFLIHGVVKKRPEHMKAYFVYGVVVLTLVFLAGLITAFCNFMFNHNFYRADQVMPFAILILLIFIYTLILSMIRKTYRQMEAFNQQYDPQLLLETEKC